MPGKNRFSLETRARAAQMRANGMSVKEIGQILGCSPGAVLRWTTPGYRDRQNASSRLRIEYQAPQWKLDAERLLKAIPPDTRDLTGRICGDPLPGRRAIDKQGSVA